MSRFLAIASELQSRVEGISVADGYNYDLGDSVYFEGLQPVPVVDGSDEFLPGSVILEPGDISTPDESGETRSGAVVLDTLLDRTVTVVVVRPISDKSEWLTVSERVGSDLRRAFYAMPASVSDASVTDWRTLGVKSIAQTGQSATRPQTGGRALYIETQFRIRYSEN